jgi:excisionase family DNA binding protein
MARRQMRPPTLYCSLKNMPFDSSSEIELLTIAEVAQLLKISMSGVRRLQRARCLPFIKVGASVRFSRRDIASYLEKRRVEPIG